ncbi:MAG: GNAT family N-acetyltransferase [Pirellulales bacterium]
MNVGSCQIREISDSRELEDLRLTWKLLLSKTLEVEFFQSLDWLLVFWKYYGRHSRMRVLVISHDGQPTGILPLMVAREPTRLGNLRILTYPLREWGPFYGPIGPNPTATLALGLAHVARTPRDWDMIDLRCVPFYRWDHGRTATALRVAGLAAQKRPWGQVSICDLSHGWDHYWETRSRRWRRNVRRCDRRLSERGQVTYVRYRPAGTAQGEDDPRWDLYEACEKIAAKSWQGHATNGNTLSHPEVREFLREAHVAATRAGAVDINLLLLDDTPAAFLYCYHMHGRLMGLRMGFDKSSASEGAGTVLMQRTLADSCQREDVWLNLGADYLDCKRYWQTKIEPTFHYTHFAPLSLRGQLIRLKRSLERVPDTEQETSDEPEPEEAMCE